MSMQGGKLASSTIQLISMVFDMSSVGVTDEMALSMLDGRISSTFCIASLSVMLTIRDSVSDSID